MKATYKIDPTHSTAQFIVRHLMITNVRGAFSKVEGSVVYDSDNPGATQIEATIDVASLNTNDAARDTHLKSPDFLDAAKYPAITFKSTSATPSGQGEMTATGELTIHGVTKEEVLKIEGPSSESKDPWGNLRIGASATTKIKRSDFGLTYNAALETGGVVLSDDLKIELEVSLVKQA